MPTKTLSRNKERDYKVLTHSAGEQNITMFRMQNVSHSVFKICETKLESVLRSGSAFNSKVNPTFREQ
jgi:hypothetical protein